MTDRDTTLITGTTRSLAKLKSRLDRSSRLRSESVTLDMFERFLDHEDVGGTAGIAEFMGRTHEAVANSEKLGDKVRWSRHLMAYFKAVDEQKANALEAEYDEEDLNNQMIAALIETMHQDTDFALAIKLEADKALAPRIEE